MNCPNCNFNQFDGYDCPICGFDAAPIDYKNLKLCVITKRNFIKILV
jgi:methionyl-tRNA synthetase